MFTRLGTYEIEGLLGVGGMGEVYAARDKKLGRSVALKVLPENLQRDPERVSRFEREAKVLASLNHANIATLHGIEESEGKHFLIMELVEGETLAERIKRGPIPVEEALRIARQISEALEAAHEKGIVHRDLKPANVKVTPEERVKVLDFGLAKAMQSVPGNAALSNSPTLTMAATQAGIILGTAAYMSPEQAKALEADHRSDVFSFGCVLYEMLTARQAFAGDTVSEILAAVLIKEPDLSLLPANLNPRISEILRRCLAKNPKLRWQATGDLRAELEGGEPEEMIPRGPSEAFHGPQLIDEGRWLLFTLTTEQGEERWDKAQIVAQSMDSKKERRVLVRGGSDARYLPTGHLVYALGGTLYAVPLDVGKMEVRGNPVPVLEGVMRALANNTAAAHFAFSTTGSLIYVPGGTVSSSVPQRVLSMMDRTGKVQPLSLPVQFYGRPRISPDGGQLAYVVDDGREAAVWIMDLKGTAPPQRLTFGGRNVNPMWNPDGHSVTFQSNREGDWGLFQQQAGGAAKRLTKAGQAVPHVPESWSPDGKTLVYRLAASGLNANGIMSISPEGDGKATPFLQSVAPSITQANVTFSPDGRWVAYNSNEPDGTFQHVFVQPFPPTGAKYQVSDLSVAPVWSRDGKELFYFTLRDNRIVAAEVTTTPTFKFGKSTSIPGLNLAGNTATNRNYDLTPDGKHLIVVTEPSTPQPTTTKQSGPQMNVVLNWFEELNRRAPIQ